MKKLLLVGLSILLCSSAFGATLEEGLDAYEKKDYPSALENFRPLAEQGNASAQVNLGDMYVFGQAGGTEFPSFNKLSSGP